MGLGDLLKRAGTGLEDARRAYQFGPDWREKFAAAQQAAAFQQKRAMEDEEDRQYERKAKRSKGERETRSAELSDAEKLINLRAEEVAGANPSMDPGFNGPPDPEAEQHAQLSSQLADMGGLTGEQLDRIARVRAQVKRQASDSAAGKREMDLAALEDKRQTGLAKMALDSRGLDARIAAMTRTKGSGGKSAAPAPAPVSTDDPAIGQYVSDLAEGKIALSQVPTKVRNAVQAARSKSGSDLMTTKQREAAAALSKAEPTLALLGQLSERINTGSSGIGSLVSGKLAQGAGALGMNPDVAQYEKTAKGMIPMLARAIGHSGVLTEQDAARTEELLPQPTDTAELAMRKRNALNAIIADVKASASGKPVKTRTLEGYIGAASGSSAPSSGRFKVRPVS